jgi:hypothetical protein
MDPVTESSQEGLAAEHSAEADEADDLQMSHLMPACTPVREAHGA